MTKPASRDEPAGKLLCLIRHGRALPQDVRGTDFERPLDEDGRRECRRTAALLARQKTHFDLLISSPADRAIQTAHIFADALEYSRAEIKIEKLLYDSASTAAIAMYVRQLDASSSRVALFGHNPSFEQLLAYYVADTDLGMKKGGVAGIAFAAGAWKDVGRSQGALLFWISPKSGIVKPGKNV